MESKNVALKENALKHRVALERARKRQEAGESDSESQRGADSSPEAILQVI